MRLAFFYPSSSVSKPIDVVNLWTSSRGLTGSEITCIMYAIEMAKLGHSVNLFTKVEHAADSDGVIFIPYKEWESTYCTQHWDVACSWMNPEPLSLVSSKTLRFFNQQVSDVFQCPKGWENYVDFLAPLSNSHAHFVSTQTDFPKNKYRILYNGTDTNTFKPGEKIPGKMIWASSHDRGLHWLLEAFPRIKKAVPEANLHIFYNFEGIKSFSKLNDSSNPFYDELGRRARYSLEAIDRLKGKGVFVHESVSREQIREEMASSEVLAYPLDPVRYTETFGVTVLEACASGTVPIICAADAFKELWSPVCEYVDPPYSQHKDEFLNKVIHVMSNKSYREKISCNCVEYAKKFDWKLLALDFDAFINSSGEFGLKGVNW